MSRRESSRKRDSVDLARVQRLAELSRLSLAPKEAERLRGELSSILDYFAALDKVQLPASLAVGTQAPAGGVREDVVRPSAPDEILEGVPQKKGRLVRAPRVF